MTNKSLTNEALLNRDEKSHKYLTRIINGLVSFILETLKLNNTGKYISLGVIICVLYFMHRFLSIQGYSYESMKLVIPYLGSLASLVFGFIAGVRGVNGIIEKFTNKKSNDGE